MVRTTACSARAAPTAPPALEWTSCPTDPQLLCSALTVPLDRAEPDGATVVLPVVKVPARQPGQRLGSLVLPRGGPGYSERRRWPPHSACTSCCRAARCS